MAKQISLARIFKPKTWQTLLRYILLILLGILFIAPVFWMISSSLKPDYEIFAFPIKWWPAELQ
jgi:ABC-type glycerol-3-phosphate transport system permease component